jgi:hypothetical protein
MSTQENTIKVRELVNKYPNNLKVIQSEAMVNIIDMDAVMKAGTTGMSDYKNDDSAWPDFISKQLTSGKDVAILPKGKDSVLIFVANGLFKKGW